MRSLRSRDVKGDAGRLTPRALAAGLLLAFGTSLPATAQPATAPSDSAAISADRLMATVRELSSSDYAGREVGTPGGMKARAWIRDRFEAAGLRPIGGSFEQAFSFAPAESAAGAAAMPSVNGVNLVGRCAGRQPSRPAIVVSAHYDHLGVRDGRTFPGADDNASGVAVLLELAGACVAAPFDHDLIFVAFDAEERNLQGARAFVAFPPVPRGRLALDVNLDMVARGDTNGLYIAGLRYAPALRPLLEPVAAGAPIAVRFGHDTPGSGHDDWTEQSDHGVFHEAGIPFVYFGVEDHPDYHQPTDTAGKIDPTFFARAATVVLNSLRALDQGLRQP